MLNPGGGLDPTGARGFAQYGQQAANAGFPLGQAHTSQFCHRILASTEQFTLVCAHLQAIWQEHCKGACSQVFLVSGKVVIMPDATRSNNTQLTPQHMHRGGLAGLQAAGAQQQAVAQGRAFAAQTALQSNLQQVT